MPPVYKSTKRPIQYQPVIHVRNASKNSGTRHYWKIIWQYINNQCCINVPYVVINLNKLAYWFNISKNIQETNLSNALSARNHSHNQGKLLNLNPNLNTKTNSFILIIQISKHSFTDPHRRETIFM